MRLLRGYACGPVQVEAGEGCICVAVFVRFACDERQCPRPSDENSSADASRALCLALRLCCRCCVRAHGNPAWFDRVHPRDSDAPRSTRWVLLARRGYDSPVEPPASRAPLARATNAGLDAGHAGQRRERRASAGGLERSDDLLVVGRHAPDDRLGQRPSR